jgi:hypothetical protein
MGRQVTKKFFAATILFAFIVSWAAAKNVDLVTLPSRDTVQLTIYNSEDITLVKETRYVTLKQGMNKLQFSWSGTLIDPTSVDFRALEHADRIEVADTTFLGQKPQHLIWNIESEYEGQVKVEVSYFTSGLTWTMDYVALTDPDETQMQFRGHVRVFNNSGEEYENAEVRLIVGTINLVEKIADLARRYGIPVPTEESKEYERLKHRVVLQAIDTADELGIAGRTDLERPKQIIKEGISEYFMFAVEGTETIRNGWSKRMCAVKADDVSFDIVYRMRAYQYGPRPVRFFIWKNDEDHELGDSPLPDGLVCIFRDNGKDGLSYLGQQLIRYVPIDAEIEVNLGPDDLVVYETNKMSTQRFNFHFDKVPQVWRVDGWDETQEWLDTVRNYRTKPITFELRRIWDGDVDYYSDVETTLFDYRTTDTKFTIEARDKMEYPCTVTLHMGFNKKQDRVNLK